MKILLVNPRHSAPQMDEMEPLGICYLSSYLKAAGHECAALHQTYFDPKPVDDIVEKARRDKTDLVGFATYSSNINTALDLCRKIKAETGAKTLLGGPMATAMPELVENPDVDFVIMGEAEKSIATLAKALESGDNRYSEIPGLCRLDEGSVRANPAPPRIEDLDSLPFPDRANLPYEHYFCSGYVDYFRKRRIVTVLTSRGCPFNCEYCATKKIWHNRWHSRSVGNVMEEIEGLFGEFPEMLIGFIDQDININKERAHELYETLVERFNRPGYGIMTSILSLDEKLIKTLDRTGCLSLFLGIESGSKEVLDSIGRRFELDRTLSILKMLNKTDIFIVCAFLVGFPADDHETIKKTRWMIRHTPADFSFVSMINPYPGTDLYHEAIKQGWITPEKYIAGPEKLLEPFMPTYHLTRREVRREFFLTTLTCVAHPGYFLHVAQIAFAHPRRLFLMIQSLISQARLAFRVLRFNLFQSGKNGS